MMPTTMPLAPGRLCRRGHCFLGEAWQSIELTQDADDRLAGADDSREGRRDLRNAALHRKACRFERAGQQSGRLLLLVARFCPGPDLLRHGPVASPRALIDLSRASYWGLRAGSAREECGQHHEASGKILPSQGISILGRTQQAMILATRQSNCKGPRERALRGWIFPPNSMDMVKRTEDVRFSQLGKVIGIYDRDYYGGTAQGSWFSRTGARSASGSSPSMWVCFCSKSSLARWGGAPGRSGILHRCLCSRTVAGLEGQVWRLLTYAFLHDPRSLWHILFNMLFLWWGSAATWKTCWARASFWLLPGLSALWAVWFYVCRADSARRTGICIGDSGAVTAVLVLCAFYYPSRIILVFFLPCADLAVRRLPGRTRCFHVLEQNSDFGGRERASGRRALRVPLFPLQVALDGLLAQLAALAKNTATAAAARLRGRARNQIRGDASFAMATSSWRPS